MKSCCDKLTIEDSEECYERNLQEIKSEDDETFEPREFSYQHQIILEATSLVKEEIQDGAQPQYINGFSGEEEIPEGEANHIAAKIVAFLCEENKEGTQYNFEFIDDASDDKNERDSDYVPECEEEEDSEEEYECEQEEKQGKVCEPDGRYFDSMGSSKKHQLSLSGASAASKPQKDWRGSKKNSQPKEKIPCETCGKILGSKTSLKQHQAIHSDARQFQCKYCPKAFKQKHGLKTHERVHTGEKPFSCKFCEKKFADPSTHAAHTRTHTGDRPYQCEICGKKFNNTGHLKRHKRIHSGDKPYECKKCGRNFNQQMSLKVHLRTHDGIRPFSCNLCEKTFVHSSHVNRHRKRFHSTDDTKASSS